MEIATEQIDNAAVTHLSGRLDTGTAPTLETEFARILGGGARHIVVECADLAFVSSVGLRAFLQAAKRLKPVGGRLSFACMQPQVRQVFELAGFSSLFQFFATREDALSSGSL